MKMQVLPSLKKCRSDEWTPIRGKFCRVKGIKEGKPGTGFVHWVSYNAASFDKSMREVSFDLPLGTVVIFVGFTQSEMRFSELAWYFLKYGLNVLIVEHRGHGFSSREISDPEVVKVLHWKDYKRDFAAVVEDARKKGYLSRPL
ncbi:MAG: alpha/beta hydrolase, partial [Aeriscardovia sp.]|nr:alpha/beta hydrolase [Aeriscardovia sp.]